MSQDNSFLATVKAAGDPTAQGLVTRALCEWVRSRFGILGLIRLATPTSSTDLKTTLDALTADAYGQLDELEPSLLSRDDLWSLLLFASLPWTEEEAAGNREIRSAVQEYASDLKGSRKIVLWAGRSAAEYLGRVATSPTSAGRLIGDPVRQELNSIAVDTAEREALQILLQRRITESDLENLIGVLGSRPNDDH